MENVNMKTLVGAAVALGMMAGTPALALPYHHHRPIYVVHHAGPARVEAWRRGAYVPGRYRVTNYYVTDWETRRLHRPAAGYVWVRNDNGQFVLMGRRSGMIYEIVNP